MKKGIGFFILYSSAFLPFAIQAASILSANSGNWTNANIWNGGVVPGSSDTALIDWDDTIEVDTSNKVGIVKFDGGASIVNINSGGVLDIGEISPYLWRVEHVVKNFDQTMNVQGGKLIVNGEYRLFGGGLAGFNAATNYLSVSGSSEVNLLFTEVGWWSDHPNGKSIVNLEGGDATFIVSQNWSMGEYGGLRWVASSSGAVSPIQSKGFEGTASVLVNGTLEVDLSAVTNYPLEIILIDNGGSDAISGTFDSVNIVGSSAYDLSYTGGDGNDLSLGLQIDFDVWASIYDLSGTNATEEANPDGDALNNLYEFGLGGDPTNGTDIGYVPTWDTVASGGTNWFEYVHARRITPGNELTYYLEQNADLSLSSWTNSGDYIEVGTGPLDAAFESVTNRIPTDGKTKEFIRLIIE